MKSAYSLVLETYLRNHQLILDFAEKRSAEELTWQAVTGSLSIAFYLWHLARWADHLQAAIPGMTPELTLRLPQGCQIWEREQYARQWGFVSNGIGYAETGMNMDETAAARLAFPTKYILIDYVRKAFAAVEQAANAIDEDQFLAEEQPQPLTEGVWEPGNTVGSAITEHLIHDERHLGMMECLLGLQILVGIA